MEAFGNMQGTELGARSRRIQGKPKSVSSSALDQSTALESRTG
jgi:hypothetical protein